jgi:hypothetical protein
VASEEQGYDLYDSILLDSITREQFQQVVASTLPTWIQVGSVLIQAVSDLDRHGTVEGSRLTSMAAIDRLSE